MVTFPHSRPHKVHEQTDFDVLDEFITRQVFGKTPSGTAATRNAQVRLGDGR
jgi:hypothetical protein